MKDDLLNSIRELFPSRKGKTQMAILVLFIAMLPVAEMAVAGLFATLVIDGVATYQEDQQKALMQIGVFIGILIVTRALHHGLRIIRVRIFKARFEELTVSNPARQAWNWALALELSGVLVAFVQVATFTALFFFFSPLTAILNLVVVAVVITIQARLYKNERERQVDYIARGTGEGTTPISDRVGIRITKAEVGALFGSVGMAVVLASIVVGVFRGWIDPVAAVTLFFGLRMLYGQMGTLSSGLMRFSRALARTGMAKEPKHSASQGKELVGAGTP